MVYLPKLWGASFWQYDTFYTTIGFPEKVLLLINKHRIYQFY